MCSYEVYDMLPFSIDNTIQILNKFILKGISTLNDRPRRPRVRRNKNTNDLAYCQSGLMKNMSKQNHISIIHWTNSEKNKKTKQSKYTRRNIEIVEAAEKRDCSAKIPSTVTHEIIQRKYFGSASQTNKLFSQ